jgi:hypothetical protein
MQYHQNGARRGFLAVGVIVAAFACGTDARAEAPEPGKPAKTTAVRHRNGAARPGFVRVKVDLPGAEVLVDGKLVGTAPLERPLRVDPGRHVIHALGAEIEDSRQIDVTEGATSDVDLRVAPRLDEKEADKEPEKALSPAPSSLHLLDSAPAPARDDDAVPRGIVEGGIAATMLVSLFGLGTGAAAAARDAASEARRDEPCRSCPGGYNDMQRDAAMLANTSLWSFVAAGAIAAGTAFYVLSLDGDGGNGSRTGIVVRAGTLGFETNF